VGCPGNQELIAVADPVSIFNVHSGTGPVLPAQIEHPPNLGIFDSANRIFRGGAPGRRADPGRSLSWLRDQGVRTVAVLNESEQGVVLEEELALSGELDLRAVTFDWEGMLAEKAAGDEPRWQTFLSLIDAGALYVHCIWGVDRTGATLARARCERYGWSATDAFRELRAYGFAFECPVERLQDYQKEVLAYFEFGLEDYEPLSPGHPDHTACVVRRETAIG